MDSWLHGVDHVVRPAAPEPEVWGQGMKIKGRLRFMIAVDKCHSEDLLCGVTTCSFSIFHTNHSSQGPTAS